MARIEPRLLKGFRDYLPEQMIPRQRMLDAVARVFERHGFPPLQTPAIEYAEILLGKYGADAERLLYRFEDNGGRDICLRYDLTVPLARVAAQYGNLPMPFRRYQIAPVWRAEKPGKGRFREFFQCDVDVVGSDSLLADAECVAVDHAVLTELGVERFVVRINNRKILTGWFEAMGLGSGDDKQGRGILRTVDKLPSMGEDKVRELLATDNGLGADAIDCISHFLSITGDNAAKLAAARELLGGTGSGRAGLEELSEVIDSAVALGVPTNRIEVDFSIARGLDYYTGSVFETFLQDLPDFGSVMSGGRYDALISTFLGREMPAVGISVGVDRLFSAMLELGLVREAATTTRVLLCPLSVPCVRPALEAAAGLRRAGIATEIFLQPAKLRKQLKYANQRGIPVAVILGEEEVERGVATVKRMQSGEQAESPLTALAEAVAVIPDSTTTGQGR
jgi:histidyl-tRNA synthetase